MPRVAARARKYSGHYPKHLGASAKAGARADMAVRVLPTIRGQAALKQILDEQQQLWRQGVQLGEDL